ncbi:MAG: hypothetical protein J6J00_00855 [Treponema sp.]|nr:hypothetical protein [Treponema sp.]
MYKKISITCPDCGNNFEDELEQWPHPDMTADTATKSRDTVGGVLICPKCGKKIDYSISEDFNGYVICEPSNLEIIKDKKI